MGVVIAYMYSQDVPGPFCDSLVGLMFHDARHSGHVCGDKGGFISMQSGPRVAEARSQVCEQFLKYHPESDWLLLIDSDMTFHEDVVDWMLRFADPKTVPVLGGLCFAGGRSSRMYPTIYEEYESEVGGIGVRPIEDYPKNQLLRVGATGAAFMMIHRQVLVAMSHPWPKGFGTLEDGRPNPYPWFIEGLTIQGGRPLGEDIAFCRRLRHMGIPVHVHTAIKTGHVKSYQLTEEEYEQYVAKKASANGTRAERRRAARELARAS